MVITVEDIEKLAVRVAQAAGAGNAARVLKSECLVQPLREEVHFFTDAPKSLESSIKQAVEKAVSEEKVFNVRIDLFFYSL